MRHHQTKVREFHEKHDYPVRMDLTKQGGFADIMHRSASEVKILAKKLEDYSDGGKLLRQYRAGLILEEAAELVDALANQDEVGVADAIGDLAFLILGEAETWGMDAQCILDEVVKSNETKAARDPESNARLRDKGPDYQAPDMRKAIDRGREIMKFSLKLEDEVNNDTV